MRTKALLGLAALAVGLSTSVAQNVYSLNVVGYVNVPLTANQLSFLSLPVEPVNGNFNITNTIVLDDTQDGALLYKWLGTGWDPTLYAWYAGAGWSPDTVISNGVGFFISPAATSTLTFVGQVPQSTTAPIAYSIPAGLSTLANKVPVSANFPGSANGNDGDTIYLWNSATHGWSATLWSYYGGTGWDNGGGAGNSVNGPMLNPADGVFYANSGATISFSQNFTVAP